MFLDGTNRSAVSYSSKPRSEKEVEPMAFVLQILVEVLAAELATVIIAAVLA